MSYIVLHSFTHDSADHPLQDSYFYFIIMLPLAKFKEKMQGYAAFTTKKCNFTPVKNGVAKNATFCNKLAVHLLSYPCYAS